MYRPRWSAKVQVPGSVGTTWYGPGIGPTLMNNVAWTANHPTGDKLKWKALCGHLMPTEYVDYVTFVFGYVHLWCCHKFVCLCIKCVVEGQRAGTCMRCFCGFICTTYLIISCGFYVNFSPPLREIVPDNWNSWTHLL